ncbi:putative uncharacterized protein DDB_G0272516 [Leptopilina heterotoma]|uniref:putative uncharacterized protein DDB_G0272516 n=1 Tax=Leptopilina heterotoma TaxID=63436 RepID=UPI001CA91F89|nr:putative uncharacterized protein DDB_G0272516 [Leptopilina heterotoma]
MSDTHMLGENKSTYSRGPRGRGYSRPSSQNSQNSELSSPSPGTSMFCSSILTSAERLQITSKTQDDKLKQIQDTAKENQHQDIQMTSPNFNNKRNFSGSHNNSGISPLIQKNTRKRIKNTGNPHDHNNNGSTKANTSHYTNNNIMIPKETHPSNETQTLSLNKAHIEQNQLLLRSPPSISSCSFYNSTRNQVFSKSAPRMVCQPGSTPYSV